MFDFIYVLINFIFGGILLLLFLAILPVIAILVLLFIIPILILLCIYWVFVLIKYILTPNKKENKNE